jgi:glycerophosphoryl diester phosphodiesterase
MSEAVTPTDQGSKSRAFTVIAHRGASGYLPEHTLEATAMAHAMGADFIEQDVVLTRDGALVVLHDLYLDAVTDVAIRFADRMRQDGHHYALDFDLEEIRTLHVNERKAANGLAAFPGRFPDSGNIFRVPTLEEQIILIQGMNHSTGRNVGLYIEPKSPAWHGQHGRDILAESVSVLSRYGYESKTDRVLLQSFDADTLKRARDELNSALTLVQLIGENSWGESDTDFDQLLSPAGLGNIKTYADGIGPWLLQIAEIDNDTGTVQATPLIEQAHRHDLFVHAYTLRADQLPEKLIDFDQAMNFLTSQTALDGVFTDFPDKAIQFLKRSPTL